MNIDEQKLKPTMELIDAIADEAETGGEKVPELVEKLRAVTGKPELRAEDCMEYWGWTDLEDLAVRFLTPEPKKQNLSDEQLSEIIHKICAVEYDEPEMDYQLKVLEQETGLGNITDYIFYPDEVGLDFEAGEEEIIAKILADRK